MENSEDVSDIIHENFETGEIIDGTYTCVQIKEETVETEEEIQNNFHDQEDFKDKNNSLDDFESDFDYIQGRIFFPEIHNSTPIS